MKLLYWPKFKNQYKKLKPQIKIKVKEKLNLFSNNPYDTRLKTHKLTGRLDGFHAFSIDQSYRVIFKFNYDATEAEFHLIGTHDIYN